MITFKEGYSFIKVLDEPTSERELEKDMIDWNMQTIKQKRLSDDKSIELFGKNNESRYIIYKDKFLKKPDDKEITTYDGISPVSESFVDFDKLGKTVDTAYKIIRSKKYRDIRNIIVIYPTSNKGVLEKLKADFDAMPNGDKLHADDYCRELWSVTNDEMYRSCLELIDRLDNNNMEDPLANLSDDKITDGLDKMRITSTVEPTTKHDVNTIKESYVLESYDVNKSRADNLRQKLYEYNLLTDKNSDEARALEETILNLGWIPGIPYDSESMTRAALFESSGYNIIDKTKDDELDDSPVEKVVSDILRPVYIVLVAGDSLFSGAIKAFTKGPFSHAAICIDNTFKKMYSFNIGGSEGKMGGLSIENAKAYPKDSKLGVYAIFVKEKDYNTIENLLQMYDGKKKDTAYSFLNVLTLPFNISIKQDFNMICSEFVDNILKLTNINIVDKDSPLVTPNDFYRSSKSNNKIFKLYEGKVRNFVPKMVVSRANKVKKVYIKELALLEADFPIQFSKDGDLLIKNMKKLDYSSEVSKANRLLKIYYKEDNREGMKYELCKLWFICSLIGNDIDAGKNKVENTKTKATAFNIFNTYLKLLLQKEKNFNFMKYYETTPFNDATIRVKGSTIKYSMELLKATLFA